VLKKLAKKVANERRSYQREKVTNPFDKQGLPAKLFTQRVIDLYEKQSDIKRFSKLVFEEEITDDFLNTIQAELASKDIFDPFGVESFKGLAQNKNLLEDLTIET